MSMNSTVVDANGRKTEVWETGEGEPLVYLHGGGIVEGFDFLERIADRYKVYLPLLPGYGATELEPAPRNHEEVTAALTDALDALGLDRFVLVGHSLGGWRAVAFAAAHPERVSRLVLGCPYGMDVPEHPMLKMHEHTLDERKQILTGDPSVWEGRIAPEPDEEFLALRAREQGVMAGFVPGHSDPDLPARLATLSPDLEILLLWGEDDRLVPVEHSRAWAAALPQATVHTLPGSGHLFFNEKPELAELIATGVPADEEA